MFVVPLHLNARGSTGKLEPAGSVSQSRVIYDVTKNENMVSMPQTIVTTECQDDDACMQEEIGAQREC